MLYKGTYTSTHYLIVNLIIVYIHKYIKSKILLKHKNLRFFNDLISVCLNNCKRTDDKLKNNN